MHTMMNDYGKHTLRCAVLVLGLSGCQDWVRELIARGEEEPPPTAAEPSSRPEANAAVTKALLPKAPENCPAIQTGTAKFAGHDVKLWVGEGKEEGSRPVVVYWHGTGSSADEAKQLLSPVFDDILAQGGIIASLTDSTEDGEFLATGTWYTGDYAIVDALVGCLGEHANIDPQRIYTAGCDAGGIHAAALSYARSNYIAAAMLSSGGQVQPYTLQDPKRVPAVIAAHGEANLDVVIVDFSATSAAFTKDLVDHGGFAVKCNHHGGHCGAPSALVRAQWEFLQAHPYGVDPEPYADGLPDSFPDYCEIVQ
jgi:hypothetical protein